MQVAVMGFGTVGSGVVELMDKNRDSIVERSGQNSLEVKYILDIRDFPDSIYKDKLVKDFNVILNDDDVKIVVETMGGLKPAYEFVKKCLEKAKEIGFKILQFNAVVATNTSALKLYKKLGFIQLGKIPNGFLLKNGKYEDIIPHYIELK